MDRLIGADNPIDEDGEPGVPDCVLEVETGRLRRNLEAIRAWTPARLMAVVKSNGYGLGLIPYARLLQEGGVDCFAVASPEEGLTLRRSGIRGTVLVMTPPESGSPIGPAMAAGLSLTVGAVGQLTLLEKIAAALGVTAPIQLKLETGFGRYGIPPEEVPGAAALLKDCPHLRLEGVYSHCGVTEPRWVVRRFALFRAGVDTLRAAGVCPEMLHFCNSSLALAFPAMHLDVLRVGSLLLGRTAEPAPFPLEPVGMLRARVVALHGMGAGSRPGYAGRLRLGRETRVAVAAAGWQDGLGLCRAREVDSLWALLAQARRLLGPRPGPRAYLGQDALPILGRGGMHFTLLDATDVPLRVGDPVRFPVNPLLVPERVPRSYIP